MSGFELGDCPVCGTNSFHTLATADDIKREVQVYAREEPSREALDSLFLQQLEFFRPRVQRLRRFIGKPGRLLEVGSYLGAFLSSAQAAGWQCRGLDLNATANRFAAAQGCDVTQARIEDVSGRASLDVIAFWNCFDQLADPRAALVHCRQLLDRGGLLVLRVPNGAFYSALRRQPVAWPILAHNNLLAFPYRFGFTARALRQLLSELGFERLRVRGDALVVTAGSWTKGWAVRRERLAKRSLRLLPGRLAPWLEVYARAPQQGMQTWP